MKKLFNKYCDFIGVENEGNKRLFIISSIIISPIICFSKIINGWNLFDFMREIFEELLFIIPQSILYPIYLLFVGIFSIITSFILLGLIYKTYNWVKDGYKK